MTEDVFVINLLPCEDDLHVLSQVKNYFYTHDFKYGRKDAPSRPHLTLAKLLTPTDWELFRRDLELIASRHSCINAPIAYITDEITATPVHPDGEGWVALIFTDQKIRTLFASLEAMLDIHMINQNQAYIAAIKAIKGDHLDTFDCIANHINMCNHCYPERVSEAQAYIQHHIPPRITFDRLIVRRATTDEEDVRLEVPLHT